MYYVILILETSINVDTPMHAASIIIFVPEYVAINFPKD